MSIRDSLGDRMKEYESISRTYLTRKIPVIIRLDGKAFHTFTKGLKKPFDNLLMKTMQETMQYLCSNIQGCVFGYTQSDEITLVLTDYTTIETDSWFGYNLQKMCSVSASMATLAFNKFFMENVNDSICYASDVDDKYVNCVSEKMNKAMFDSRAFSIPKEEVINCLIWRQQDATRNSIMAVGQANFSHKELHGKTCDKVQDMLFVTHGINWNDFPTMCKRGTACYKAMVETETATRRKWIIDKDIPVFTQDRNFVERWL